MCEREISLLPCNGDGAHFLKAELTDCSLHGLGMLVPQAIEAGQQVLVRIEIDRQPTLLLYTIRYCIPITPQQFRAGARFTGFVASRFRGELKSVVATLAGRS